MRTDDNRSLRGYYRRDFADAWKRYVLGVKPELVKAAETDRPDAEEQQEAEPPRGALFHASDGKAADGCGSQSATATQVQQVSLNKDAPRCTVAVAKGGTREEENMEGEL